MPAFLSRLSPGMLAYSEVNKARVKEEIKVHRPALMPSSPLGISILYEPHRILDVLDGSSTQKRVSIGYRDGTH